MSIEELEDTRLKVRQFIRSLEDEEEEPSLAEGRRKAVRELWEVCRAEFLRKRSVKRSPGPWSSMTISGTSTCSRPLAICVSDR
jgi:hypothetical protein